MTLIEHAILSTDLAIYFRKKNRFISMVENGEFDWQDPDQKDRMKMINCYVELFIVEMMMPILSSSFKFSAG